MERMLSSDPTFASAFSNHIKEVMEKAAADIRDELIEEYNKEFDKRLKEKTATLVMSVHDYYEVQSINQNLVITVRNPEC